MVLIPFVRDYIDRMLHDIPGMKVLVLDPQTVGMVSVVYSQSDLLRKEVFLVETMDNASSSRESMAHLKAVYFLRPSADNVQKLRKHLAMPRFAEYHLFFSNILKIPQIQILADSDEQEVVQQVQEFYADFCAIDPYHFTLNIQNNHMYMLPMVVDPPGMQSFCDRAVDGIASVFLALKRRPVIRFQRTSDVAKRIAQETAVGQLSLQTVIRKSQKLDVFKIKFKYVVSGHSSLDFSYSSTSHGVNSYRPSLCLLGFRI